MRACNTDLKFGSLLTRAHAWDAAGVATGHYARIDRDRAGERWVLRRARDLRKDQSDFLWPLTQSQLAAARFPIGDLTKDEVREHARRLDLTTADKPESQEICFVPDGNYRGFLQRRDPNAFRAGPIVDGLGRTVGRSSPASPGFTIGQRKGLGLSNGRPLYVIDLDADTHQVMVGEAADLERDRLRVSRAHFIAGAAATRAIAGDSQDPAQSRARRRPRSGVLEPGRAEVVFDAPQRAITPGQSCVWYRGDEVVGGGVIERRA